MPANVLFGNCTRALAPKEVCFAACAAGFKQTTNNGMGVNCTQPPSGTPYLQNYTFLACAPENCTLPASFGSNVVAKTPSAMCAPGAVVPWGTQCEVMCASGYVQIGGTRNGNTFYCKQGNLQVAAPVCEAVADTCQMVTLGGVVNVQAGTCFGKPYLGVGKSCTAVCNSNTFLANGGTNVTYSCPSANSLTPTAAPTCMAPSMCGWG